MFNTELYEEAKEIPLVCTKRSFLEYGHLIKWPHNKSINVLDVGCGEGSATVGILQELVGENVKDFRITAVDLLDDMILKANEKFGDQKRCYFEQMDITIQSIEERFLENFDLIFSTCCLHLTTNNGWVDNIFKMLKPNGQTYLFVISQNPLAEAFFQTNNVYKWSKYQYENKCLPSPFLRGKMHEVWLSPLLEEAGFRNIVIKEGTFETNFHSRNFLGAFMKSFSGMYNTIPKNMVEDFVKDVVDCILKTLCKGNDISEGLWIPLSYVVIVAEK